MARNTKIDEAKELYHKGFKLIEIANKLDIPEGTIRSWKNRYKWDDKNATLQDKRNVAKDKNLPQQEKDKATTKEIDSILENTKITDKQKLFCIYYIKYFNATKAYQKAYESDHVTAMVNGCKLLSNTKVREEIQKLKSSKLKGAMFEANDLIQMYLDIACADINDYLEFGQREVPVIDSETGEHLVNKNGELITCKENYVEFKDSSNVDGTLISEISSGKNGIKVKLQDKLKAMEWLGKHMDILDTATKQKFELEKQKFELEKQKQEAELKSLDNIDTSNLDQLTDMIKKSAEILQHKKEGEE